MSNYEIKRTVRAEFDLEDFISSLKMEQRVWGEGIIHELILAEDQLAAFPYSSPIATEKLKRAV